MEAGYENVDDLSQDGGRMACDVEEEASMQNIEECDMDKNINHQIGIDLPSEPIQANPLGEISSSILKHIENIENKMKDRSLHLTRTCVNSRRLRNCLWKSEPLNL